MKKITYGLLLLAVLALSAGCQKKPADKVQSQPKPTKEAENTLGQEEEVSETLNETTYTKITGDNIAVAQEFVKDLSAEDFDKLKEAYNYDENMQKAIVAQDTISAVIYYNEMYGELKELKEPYLLSVGAYQYVVLPANASKLNFNYQIAFDAKQNIVGFTYAEYNDKGSAATESIPEGVTETNYTFTSGGFALEGTLTLPDVIAHPFQGEGYPVVILVHGSGASDRDESIYENKPFRDIAWYLAKQGIATFRYDKRNYRYGQEMLENKNITLYDETIEDVVTAFEMVRGLENLNPDRIYILGHSLGGYAIPRIAKEVEAAGFIFMAAPAEHMKEYILSQYEYLAKEDGTVTDEEKGIIDKVKDQVKLLENPEELTEDQVILGAYKDYWIDMAAYNAIETAKDIRLPVLVMQGERDYQVTTKQYTIWQDNFEQSPNWVFRSYELLNHFMTAGEGPSGSSEYMIKAYVSEEALKDIGDFVIGNLRK